LSSSGIGNRVSVVLHRRIGTIPCGFSRNLNLRPAR
jgi:hypothetical protein